jgi:DNA polymerase-3 subunit epsilon
VLESALLDQYLSAHEEDALIETASALGLDRDRLEAIHRDYLLSMARVARDDGVVVPNSRTSRPWPECSD